MEMLKYFKILSKHIFKYLYIYIEIEINFLLFN